MNLPDLPALFPVSEFRDRANGLADLLPYAVDLGDGVIGNIDGSFTAIYHLRGPDLTSSAPQIRMNHHFAYARALNTLREGWMVHSYVGRGLAEEYPLKGEWTSRTAWLIEQERIAKHNTGVSRYFNDMYLCFTYSPVDPKYKETEKFFRDSNEDDPLPGDEELANFINGLQTIEGICAVSLRLRRLDIKTIFMDEEGEVEADDRLSFFAKIIGGKRQQVRALPPGAHWAAAIAEPVRTGLRLSVADDLVSVITVDNVPEKARTTLMRNIYAVDQACDIVMRWIVRDEDNVSAEMKRQRKKRYGERQSIADALMKNSPFVDNNKLGEAADVNAAVSEAGSGEAHGYISFSIVVRQPIERSAGRDGEKEAAKEIDAACLRIMSALRNSHFTPRREVANVYDAWMATLPGMGYAQVRKGITGSRPISYMSPLTSVWTGSLLAPCTFYPRGSTALSYVATEGRAPMAFNLHVGNVGHTLILGATGFGKSTALAFMVAQHERYGKRSRRIILDLNRSLETLTHSMENGVHLDFSDESMRLAPFADIREPGGIEQAQSFVGFILHCNGVPYDEHRFDIHAALKSMRNGKSKPSMLALSSAPYLKSNIKEILQRYTRGREGGVLDGEVDVFPDASTLCIELERVMSMDDSLKKPLLIALINRIEKLFDGTPTLFVFDEAWKALNDEILANVIAEKIKTLRKANVAMIFGTQSISDLQGHPLEAVLMGADVPTKIFTANPMALTPVVSDQLKATGCEEWDINDIAGASRGEYFIMNPDGRRLFTFALGPVTLAFCGSNDKDSVAEKNEMMAEDEAYIAKNNRLPPRPWQARWIEKRVRGKGRDWADAWIRGPRNDGANIYGEPPAIQASSIGELTLTTSVA